MDFFQSQDWQMILQLLLAAFLGGIIGIEREAMRRAAGLKTYILVCMGCALFTITSYTGFSEFISTTSFDPSRIAAGILTGIGFIGAGTILRRENKIEGVTTAAGLWVTAAIGIAVGLKLYTVSIFAALFSLFVLTIVRTIECRVENKKNEKAKNQI